MSSNADSRAAAQAAQRRGLGRVTDEAGAACVSGRRLGTIRLSALATLVRRLAVTGLWVQAATLQAQGSASLSARVEQALVVERLVGVSWALVTPGRVTVGAAGRRDASLGTPLAPDDRVHVGSVAKAVLATGVLTLVTDGRLALDARVDTLLPMVRIDNPWATESPLLLRHLLDHTGGLDDARFRQVFTARGDPDAPLLEALGPGATVQVRARPGARFSYSNTSYLLLGMVVERTTGIRYEQWLDSTLLAPLGMTRSTFRFVSQRGRNADPALAMGHFDRGIPHDAYAIPVRPASQFTTTPTDMARFAHFLMSDGTVNGRTLVDPALLRAMGQPSGTEAARAGLENGYALGMMRRERWGIRGNCHLGNIGTFRAILCTYPEHQRAFFASYNSDPEDGNFDRVDSLLAAELGVPETPPAVQGSPAADVGEWDGWYLIRPNRFQQFAYLDAIGGVTRVRWDGNALTLSATPGGTRVLEPVEGYRFRLPGRRSASHVLAIGEHGRHVISDGLRAYECVSRWSVLSRWLGAALGVLALFYVMCVGAWRAWLARRRGALRREPLLWPSAVLWLIPLAALLYLRESPLGIGDPTPANVCVAVLTGLLPVATMVGLLHRWRAGWRGGAAVVDAAALLALLQWCVTLLLAGLLPLALWR